jgi:alkylated DNA repair protein alkB family protein 1
MHAACSSSGSSGSSAYKAVDKRFKVGASVPEEALRTVLDFDAAPLNEAIKSEPVNAAAAPWLRDARIFSIRGIDGFRFIRCPFGEEAQLHLARSAICDWIEPPADTNLPTAAGIQHSDADQGQYSRLWERHTLEPVGSLLTKLAWATVGYQYQWTDRCYDPDKRCPFPPELATTAADLAKACGWPALSPEAAIINLYGPSSTMGGHRDDAEPCQSAPIVSISLGLQAIYLLGGPTKTTSPVPMFLRSGDVIVQGGASRGYVHGVPRVLANTLPSSLCAQAGVIDSDLAPFAQWLSGHRLNINVRQVHEDGARGGYDHDEQGHRNSAPTSASSTEACAASASETAGGEQGAPTEARTEALEPVESSPARLKRRRRE